MIVCLVGPSESEYYYGVLIVIYEWNKKHSEVIITWIFFIYVKVLPVKLKFYNSWSKQAWKATGSGVRTAHVVKVVLPLLLSMRRPRLQETRWSTDHSQAKAPVACRNTLESIKTSDYSRSSVLSSLIRKGESSFFRPYLIPHLMCWYLEPYQAGRLELSLVKS